MGALHEGHLALIRRAVDENERALCSIFVNPTQFNDESDLAQYPRTPGPDIERLVEADCDLLYMPSAGEMYPGGTGYDLDWDPGALDEVMEGRQRPGHFKDVAQILKRLLEIVQPQRLYMGQKDYQQVRVVEALIAHYQLPVQLIMHPIVREPDGLAMSSRNVRLSPAMRSRAPVLHQSLEAAGRAFREGRSPKEIEQQSLERIRGAGLEPEYFSIVNTANLQPWDGTSPAIACVAAWAGEVRLIDNALLN
jgi:pantoate--beta-alanine ligase